MTVTSKEFIKEFAGKSSIQKTLVSAVAKAYEDWMQEQLLQGNDIRLPFGKFQVVENKYTTVGLIRTTDSHHFHPYRTKFTFLQRFKEAVDKSSETIKKNKENN